MPCNHDCSSSRDTASRTGTSTRGSTCASSRDLFLWVRCTEGRAWCWLVSTALCSAGSNSSNNKDDNSNSVSNDAMLKKKLIKLLLLLLYTHCSHLRSCFWPSIAVCQSNWLVCAIHRICIRSKIRCYMQCTAQCLLTAADED